MFDEALRRLKDRLLAPLIPSLARVHPLGWTVTGLAWGLGAVWFLAQGMVAWGCVCWFLNRLWDGVDGTVARQTNRHSDLGGYLDILADFVIYAAIPTALVWSRPEPAAWLPLAVLLASFYLNAASWMYLAAVLEKRRGPTERPLPTTAVATPPTLIGGAETILFFTFFIWQPTHLTLGFTLMAGLIGVGIVQRLIWAARHL